MRYTVRRQVAPVQQRYREAAWQGAMLASPLHSTLRGYYAATRLVSLPLSLDRSKHTPGSKRSHDPKAGLCPQSQECTLHLSGYSRRRSQDAPPLALKGVRLSKRSRAPDRPTAGQLSGAMPRANACRINGWWVSALTMLGILPPTLPRTSPNAPRALQASRTDHVAQHSRRSCPCNDDRNLHQ